MTQDEPLSKPLTVGELLRQYPHGQRITGWHWRNPPGVELRFRRGFLAGADRFVWSRAFGLDSRDPPDDVDLSEDPLVPGDMELAANLNEHLHELRAKLNDGHWTDRRAALLRGCQHGLIEAVRARAAGVSVTKLIGWLDDLRAWASEDPVSLDWSKACPPDPPEPDGPPLGLVDVPRRLRGTVFGMWAELANEAPAPVTSVRDRGPFIKTQEEFDRLQGIDAGSRPLGNIERILHPDPAVRNATTAPPATPTATSLNPSPVTVQLSAVHPEPVRWLWPGRIALGKLTLLVGDPGVGKSVVTLDLAARVSSGISWPDLPLLPVNPASVVLLSAEDDLADTIRPRLDAAGADPARVVAIQAVRRTYADGQTQDDYFDLTTDLLALEAAITQTSDCRAVIIDPLTAYLGKTDSHKNAEVRAILAKLFELAARHGVAVLAVSHLNKASTLPAIYRAMGSLAFVAAARAVWAVVRDANDESGRRRLFVPIKNNIAADETGLAYALEAAAGVARVVWEPGVVNMRADDALSGGRKAVVRDDATQFVIEALTANGGDVLSDDLTTAAEAAGISERTLRRAKKLVTDSYKEKGRGGRWRCKLKGGHEDGPNTHCPS